MQFIDKAGFRATAFAEYLAEYKIQNRGVDPEYTANNPHYSSVFMALFICQNGLCAYTEKRLGELNAINDNAAWNAGAYIGGILPQGIDADIDHYDSDLKDEFGWEVDNLFLCLIHNNRKIKLDKEVYEFMKPDSDGYSPNNFMTYEFATHIFVPLPSIKIENLQRYQHIEYMLNDVLGINNYSIKSRRKEMLEKYKDRIKGKRATMAELENEISEFFTAFEMSRAELVRE